MFVHSVAKYEFNCLIVFIYKKSSLMQLKLVTMKIWGFDMQKEGMSHK